MRFESKTVETYFGLLRLQEQERLEKQERLARLRAELDAIRLYLKARREEKYSPEQPRDELGRWAPWDGRGDDGDVSSDFSASAIGSAPDGTPVDGVGTSGFSAEQEKMTVQSFRSAYCLGSIREVLPSQFNQMTVGEVIALANQGDANARRCLKLLGEPRFRK